MAENNVVDALLNILEELIDGSRPEAAWVLNPEDAGLLKSLDRISAEEASAVPSGGGASVAAHVDHLRYGLELLNRWRSGEEPFADADYSASWQRIKVSDADWTAQRADLRREAYAWREAMKHQRPFNNVELTGVVASVVHIAYHMGAIRQIVRATRGPSARD